MIITTTTQKEATMKEKKNLVEAFARTWRKHSEEKLLETPARKP
jgi:hypothetical protein